jgi:hypothetical protein
VPFNSSQSFPSVAITVQSGVAELTPAWVWAIVAIAVLVLAGVIFIHIFLLQRKEDPPADDAGTNRFLKQRAMEEPRTTSHDLVAEFSADVELE